MIEYQYIYNFIIQTLQLQLVAVIFFLTFNSTITDGVNQKSFRFIGNIRGVVVKKNPLLFVAVGFLFNWIYVIISALIYWGESPLFGYSEDDLKVYQSLAFLFNVLNTCCFWLQSVPHLYISNDSNDMNPPEMSKENILLWKTIKIFAITIFSLIIWSTFGDNKLILSVFNFSGFLFVSIYLLKLTSINDLLRKKSFARYLFLIGWGIWTALQVWRAAGSSIGISDERIIMIGFTASLFAKGFILFGLYKFSGIINRLEKKELKEKNTLLEIATEQLEEINDQLYETVKSIRSLPNLINSISNSDSIEELSSKVVNHLTITNKELFDFDYALFSEVNYLEQTIHYKDSKTENKNIVDVDSWVREGGFPFDHKDVMSQVYRDRKIIHACGEIFDGKHIDINSDDSPLDTEIYLNNNHKELNRFFIPVLDSKNPDIDKNKVFAIIEVGYYIKDVDKVKDLHKTENFIKKEAELKLYIDNCAQAYKRISKQVIEKKIDLLLEECNASSKDDQQLYLEKVLKSTCELVNAKFGFIALFPMSKVSLTPNLIFSEDKLEKYELQIEKTLFECLEVDIESVEYLRIDENKCSNKIHKLLNTDSLIIDKINEYKSTIGYLIVFGKNKNFSNDVVKSTLTKITGKIYSTYNEKKFHNAVSSLITPDNAITDLEVNLQPLIEALKDYFETPHISIWLRETKDNKEYYIQRYASKELKSGTLTFYNERHVDEVELEDDYNPIELIPGDNDDKNLLFKEFGRRNNLKWLLRKPLKTQHQIFGFIHIYTNKKIDNLAYEDKKKEKGYLNYEEKNFLNLIAIKALITIQIHKLVNAFSDISASFTQNDLKVTLKTITDSALNLLNADPVILYKSNNGEDVFCSDVMFSGDFKEKAIIQLYEDEKITHVDFAEQIIKDGSKYFKNKDEYKEYIRKHPKVHNKNFEKDFWDREGIQSLAAVRLVHRTKDYERPVGVMFINFRNEVSFDDVEIKGLIKTFAAFAAGSIHNRLIFEQNRVFVLSNLRLTKPMISEAIKSGALHNAKKPFETMLKNYEELMKKINDPTPYKKLSFTDIKGDLKKLGKIIEDINEGFVDIEQLYKPSDAPIIKKKVNIARLLKEQLEFMEVELRHKLIDVTADFGDGNIYADCDEGQLGIAILNILKNSYQAIDERGKIWVNLSKIEDNKIKIEIIDDGKGISDEIKNSIFDLYVSYGKSGGSGLGLPMSKYIIEENHSGRITGRTKNGKTTFTIILPIKYTGTSLIIDNSDE